MIAQLNFIFDVKTNPQFIVPIGRQIIILIALLYISFAVPLVVCKRNSSNIKLFKQTDTFERLFTKTANGKEGASA